MIETLRRALSLGMRFERIASRCSAAVSQTNKENAMPLLDEGSPAPAFSVPNQDGTTVSLDQFAGKWLVLWWYPKADTPG